MAPVIETRKLTKHYGPVVAVQDLDLSIQEGEVFGILGPNGSGKTTTILMLLGLTEPTSGTVRVLGHDPAREPLRVKARVGYLPDSVGFYEDLTARENMSYIARLNRIPGGDIQTRISSALDRMGLSEVTERRVSTFSHGMRQRLGMADLLVKDPEMVILDEPTLGLDPEAAREFLELVRGLKRDGYTIMLSSHLLHQVQAVCDRVGLFHRGRMVLEGTVPELAQKVLGGAYRIHIEALGSGLVERFSRLEGVVRVHNGQESRYVLEASRDLRGEVAQAVVAWSGQLLSMHLEHPSLDEVYTKYFQEVANES